MDRHSLRTSVRSERARARSTSQHRIKLGSRSWLGFFMVAPRDNISLGKSIKVSRVERVTLWFLFAQEPQYLVLTVYEQCLPSVHQVRINDASVIAS